jgi:hypothetical protein
MGERVNASELKSGVLPALLRGTRREAGDQLLAWGPDRERAVLNAISLAGQVLRFTRPAVPSEFAVENWPRDERSIVPDRMRSRILRLLDRCTDDTERALALALDKLRLRPHPFDLPKLDGFVRRYTDRLGPTAQYWAQRDAQTPQVGSYFDADELGPETWTDGPLRKRLKFLRRLRNQNPDLGRQLLEKSWPTENAESRVQLLSALQTELSTGDRLFLESIQKDRAPRVRNLVQRLMGAIAGQGAENPALTACMERIQTTKTGLLKKRVELKLELPATVKEHEANRWIQEQFADVSLDEFARACALTESELVEAIEKDENLLFALALMASREGRFALVRAITDKLPDAWGRMSALNWEDGLLDDFQARQDWATALIRPKRWLPEIPFPAWSWLHRQMDGPLPDGMMREIFRSPMWAEQLNQEKKGPSLEIIQVMCALCPQELRSALRAQLEPLGMERKDKGLLLLDILDELERLT